jgi:hypothetical protein
MAEVYIFSRGFNGSQIQTYRCKAKFRGQSGSILNTEFSNSTSLTQIVPTKNEFYLKLVLQISIFQWEVKHVLNQNVTENIVLDDGSGISLQGLGSLFVFFKDSEELW